MMATLKNHSRALAGTKKAMDAAKFGDCSASIADNPHSPQEGAERSTTMDTISRNPHAPERPAGIPADWEPTLDTDGTVLDWYGHEKHGPFLKAEAMIDPAEDPTLTPKFHLTIDNERTMTAADLHEFAGQFFEFYREVCTHLPGVEVPQRLASASAVDAGMGV